MGVFSRVTDHDLSELVRWWGAVRWPVLPEQLLEMAAGHGWTLLSRTKAGGGVWDTGLMEFRPWADSSVVRGEVSTVSVSVLSARDPKDESASAGLRDAFVEQVDVLTGLLGDVAERSPGAAASVSWMLENGSSVRLGGVSSLYSVEVTSPSFVRTLEAARRLPPPA